MIKLVNKVNVPTATSTGEFDIIIRISNFSIVDGLRLLEPPLGNENRALYDQTLLDIIAKEEELSSTSVTAAATRERRMQERAALYSLRDSLMIKDEGTCVCSLRYFAKDGDTEIQLPVLGLTESFSCFVSELEEYSSQYSNVFLNKKHQMKQRIVKFLADTSFLGFGTESQYQIE